MRRLLDVVPPAAGDIQVNCCRTPGCKNFGVSPFDLQGPPRGGPKGYTLQDSVGESRLRCEECGRKFIMMSNRALAVELARLRHKNRVLHGESCSKPGCANSAKPVNVHPEEYWSHGKTKAGKPRKRCRRCGTTVTTGLWHKTIGRRGINRDIILDLVNRAALNAIMRKHAIGAGTLYDWIDFIHAQMCAFEAAKLNVLRTKPKYAGRRFALCTDGQDHMVNWLSRDRRVAIQLSCTTTADNLTGFVFRSDLNFDPDVGDVVDDFELLLRAKEFDDPERLGLFDRYEAKAYFSVVRFLLDRRLSADPKDIRAGRLLDALDKISPPPVKDDEENDWLAIGNPISGVVVRKTHTVLAHYMLLDALMPADADIHFSTDNDGVLAGMLPVAMPGRFKNNTLDMTVTKFEKELSNPKKRSRVKLFKEKFMQFAAQCQETGVTDVRRAFIKAFRTPAPATGSIFGRFWNVPIQTMYEPDKIVGIIHHRRGLDPQDEELLRLSLLDRSSLHAADSFFAVLRKRVSYFDRGGLSRATRTHYNPFAPYRPDMVQKVVDISRVYFNWCEGRPFRLVRKFKTLEQELADTGHEHIEAEKKAEYRRAKREEYTTPAMRLGLARAPIRLDRILYTDWLDEAFSLETRAAMAA